MPVPAKYAPNEPRVCPRCERFLAARNFHAKTRGPKRVILTRQTLCKTCARDRRRELRGNAPRPKIKPEQREAHRRQRRAELFAERMADPIRREEYRAKKRAQEKRRRERAKTDPAVAASIRAAQRRYHASIYADPERRAERASNARFYARDGHEPNRTLSTAIGAYDEHGREMVDAGPFLDFLSATFGGCDPLIAYDALRLDASRMEKLKTQSRVSLAVVDDVLTGSLGRPDLVNALYPIEAS